ncbi:MAG: restriction endonuclease subunit S [Candidatus Eisenbacteria bacterium]
MKQHRDAATFRVLKRSAEKVHLVSRIRASEAFDERTETGFSALPLLSVTADKGVVPRVMLDRRDTSSADKAAYKRVVPGDIAYNTMRMWQGHCGLVLQEGIVSPAYTVITPKPGVSSRYCAQLFKLPTMVQIFHRHSQGLVKDTLNLKFEKFGRIWLALPPYDQQERIATLLEAMDHQLALAGDLATALRLQKRGVMQKLLSGELQ